MSIGSTFIHAKWAVVFFTVSLAVILNVAILNPIWESHSPPFETQRTQPPVAGPVDGPFYIRNATQGYQWGTKEPLSLWFHPLMSIVPGLLTRIFDPTYVFWGLTVLCSVPALALIIRLTELLGSPIKCLRFSAPIVLFLPAGLEFGNGNAEVATLLFLSLLLLAVLLGAASTTAFLFGALAILTKPNALYMCPALTYYFFHYRKNQQLYQSHAALAGAAGIILGFMSWIVFTGWMTGDWWAYIDARQSFEQYVPGSTGPFLSELSSVARGRSDTRDTIRFLSSVTIPIANYWLIGLAPLKDESHRHAMAISNTAMLALVLILGNPNKVIVYTTTLPWFFPVNLLIIEGIGQMYSRSNVIKVSCASLLFGTYLVVMLVIYIWGTPLGWYY